MVGTRFVHIAAIVTGVVGYKYHILLVLPEVILCQGYSLHQALNHNAYKSTKIQLLPYIFRGFNYLTGDSFRIDYRFDYQEDEKSNKVRVKFTEKNSRASIYGEASSKQCAAFFCPTMNQERQASDYC